MTLYILALLIGVVAGLRSLTAPAMVSWGAHLGWLKLQATPFAFLGSPITMWIFTVLALGELVADKLPKTPSRKMPAPFIGRIITGALCGGAIAATGGSWLIGLIAGAVGGAIGTLGGAAARGKLAAAFGKDLPAALLEDVVAVGGAFAIVHCCIA